MSFKKKPAIPAAAAEAFIRGAEPAQAPTPELRPQKESGGTPAPAAGVNRFPWEDANPRIIKGINLRLPETTWAKLNFLKYHRSKSIQQIIMDALLPEIDKQIEELTGIKQGVGD